MGGRTLESEFAGLGLSQYINAFTDQGFDSWETILDIQESDLDALGVKLGHRRKLQRRIANARGATPGTLIVSPIKTTHDESQDGHLEAQYAERKSETGPSEAASHGNTIAAVPNGNGVTKRKYRRHPKPDENAPERPPSAYVLFSNKIREDLKSHNLTFTEIAKLVGENWQSLAPPEKEVFESQANSAKDKYHRELAEYKKIPEYRRYAQYLQEFKEKQAKQSQASDAAKRLKVEAPARLRQCSTSSSSTLSAIFSSGRDSGSGSGSEPPPSRKERVNSMSSVKDVPSAPPYRVSLDESRVVQLPRLSRDPSLPDGAKLATAGQRSLPPLSDMLDDAKLRLPLGTSTGGNPYGSGFVAANRPLHDGPSVLPRPPPLRHEPSFGRSSSVSSDGSYGCRPADGPLPIPTIRTGRPVAYGLPDFATMPPAIAARAAMSEPLRHSLGPSAALTGYGFESAPSAFSRMRVEDSGDGDVVMTNDAVSSPPTHVNKKGLDGMSALLRAGEIVGQHSSG